MKKAPPGPPGDDDDDEEQELFSWETKGMHRIPDHDTSIEAAGKWVLKRSKLQREVELAFYKHGPMTDEELEMLPQFRGYGISTVKKRRTEQYQKGRIVAVGRKRNSNNCTMKVWDLHPDVRAEYDKQFGKNI